MAKPEKAPLKVGMFTYAFHGGGMEMALLRLGKYLQAQGMDVEITVFSERGAWFDQIGEAGLKSVFLSHSGLETKLQRTFHYLKALTYIFRKKYDVILLNHTRYGQRAVPFLRRFSKTKTVSVLHNTDSSIFEIGLMHASSLDAVVAVGPLVEELAKQWAPHSSIYQIRNGVDLPQTLGLKEERQGKPFTLVFVGRLEHAQKGVFFLPEILETCLKQGLNLRLVIAGTGPDEDELKKLFQEKNLLEAVRFAGSLQTIEVYQLLLSSHVMLMPSFFEGFSVVLLEALVCGCLPLVTRLENITTPVIKDGETGFLIDGNDNIDMFVEKITYLYIHRDLLEKMSRKASHTAAADYSVEAMGKKYKDLILHLVNQR
ncbi:glycosyltransferase family 4 protein [Rufibacter hautae]|uniref:Glycosyltransferase family 4 protein n=1 Tax=Rufibacter hautae TaxID=2595005 RepID=A0A5B6TH21_9BACT|nr:glycosyltransferase family 4 protein [Rufibacter hautae]KAA3438552.1 glycosyltransferase family 4 protein [Rufibacter hautae]